MRPPLGKRSRRIRARFHRASRFFQLKHTAGLVFCCIYLLNQSLHDKLTKIFYRAEQEALLYRDDGSSDYSYFWSGGYSSSMTYDEFEDSLIFMAKVGAGLATLLFIIAMFLLHGVANVMETVLTCAVLWVSLSLSLA